MADLLTAALSYARRGWPVFPVFWAENGRCGCGNVDCKSPGKHPLIAGGFLNAMTDPEVVKAWWQKYPLANIGIATGKVSGLAVVDVDDEAGLSALEKLAGLKLKDIPCQSTGRDPNGWHFLFKYPGSHVKNGTKFLPGLDSRGDGGYIVAAPSAHASGKQYKLLYLPKNDEFPELSQPLLNAINEINGNGLKRRFDTAAALNGAPAGKRRDNVFKLAAKLRQADVPIDAAQELAIKATQNSEQSPGDPFTEKEALAQVEDVYKRYPAGESGVVVINESEAPEEDSSSLVHMTEKTAPDMDLSVMCHNEGDRFPEAAWTGLFATWREVIAPRTEAPLEFLWAAFLVAAGMIIGRTAWRESPDPVYPNFYLLFLGPTGDSRKSTALRHTRNLLWQSGEEFKYLSGVVSSEGIYEALGGKEGTKGLIYADEFRALLSVARRKGTQDILPKLNTLYSCPERDSIDRVKDSTEIINPFISLVAATPKAYIEDVLSSLDIEGGVINRFMIIAGAEQPPKSLAKRLPPLPWELFTTPLAQIRNQMIGHLDFTEEAATAYDDFYIDWKKGRRDLPYLQANLTMRVFEHISKIAVVYAVLGGEKQISAKTLEIAIKIGNWLQFTTLSMFADIGLDQFGKCEQAVLDLLKRAKKNRMWRRDLQRQMSARHFNGEIFNRAIKALESNDRVRCYKAVIVPLGKERPVVELSL